MLTFQPTIVRGDELIELPRPVLTCRIQDSWDFLKLKVPFKDGDEVSGPSQDGADVLFEGQIGSHAGELKLSEADMIETLLAFRAALHDTSDEGYLLALYYDTATEEYHWLQRCRTNRLEIDLSNSHLFSYAVSIHASDPAVQVSQLP